MSNPEHSFSDAEMRVLLSSIDHRVPAIRANNVIARARRRAGWHVALIAASALLAVASVSTAAVRSGFVTRLVDGIRGARHEAPARLKETSTADVNASRGVAFVAGAQVDVDFRAPQTAGAVQVRWVDSGSVLLTQTGAMGEAHYALTPTGVIVNNERSTASYTLVLPRSASRVRVRIAGREVAAKSGDVIACAGVRDAKDSCSVTLAAPRR